MNKAAIVALALITGVALADITLTNTTTVAVTTPQVVTTVTTTNMTLKDVKIVWTQFSISYAPPAYTQATYTVSYVIVDNKTKREVPNTRGVARMTEKQVFDFAASKGVDFSTYGLGIGGLLNEYLKTLFTPAP